MKEITYFSLHFAQFALSLQSEMKEVRIHKDYISKVALTTLFGLAVFCFWMFVRPALVVEREAIQLFLWNSDYLMSRIIIPGGLARYVAEFLVQYFMSEAAGACVIAVLLVLLQRCMWVLLRRCLPAVKEKVLSAFSFLPSVALWYLLCDMDTSMTLLVAVLLTLLLLLLLPSKRNASLLSSFVLVPVGYWIVGPMVSLIAVFHLRWLRLPAKKVRVWTESVAMMLLLVACVVVSSYFVPYSLSNMAKGIDYFSIQRGKIGTLEMMEYDYLQRKKAWEMIVGKAAKEEPHSRSCVNESVAYLRGADQWYGGHDDERHLLPDGFRKLFTTGCFRGHGECVELQQERQGALPSDGDSPCDGTVRSGTEVYLSIGGNALLQKVGHVYASVCGPPGVDQGPS